MTNPNPIQVFKSCCFMVVFNTDNGQCRYYANAAFEDLTMKTKDFIVAYLKDKGIENPFQAPDLKDAVLKFLGDTVAQAPSTAQVVANMLMHDLGMPTVPFAEMPHPPTSHQQELDYICGLMEALGAKHQQRTAQAMSTAISAAMAQATGLTAEEDGAEGRVVAPMMVLPLDKDGNVDESRIAEFAPGTAAYEEIRRQVIEPNRVSGNGTIH